MTNGEAQPDGREGEAGPDTAPRHGRQTGDRPSRCVVHIGLNKTGSTTIQGWLAQNADLLAAQGIRYDPFHAPGTAMHHAIGFAAIGTHRLGRLMPLADALETLDIATLEDQAERLAEFEARADSSISAPGCETYVISSEFLPTWLRQPEWATLFHDWLAQRFDTIQYVIYLRDQIDWLPSAYAQYVKSGGTRTLDEFIETRGFRNYLRICERWRRGVSPAPLDIRLLEPDFLTGGDLIADFAGVIGADPGPMRPIAKLNEAVPADTVEKIRRVNLEAETSGEKRAERIAAMRDLLAEAHGDKLRLTEEQALNVARQHAESNERLRRRFFRRRKILFPKSHEILTGKSGAHEGQPATPGRGAALTGPSEMNEQGGSGR